MANSKVSGLALIAAFLDTHEIMVNEAGISKKATGAQIRAALPMGTLGYAQAIADQGSITTAVDLTGLSVTVTAGTGRRLRITGLANFVSTVLSDTGQLIVAETGGATLQVVSFSLAASGSIAGYAMAQAIIQPSAGSHTYKLQAARQNGTGTWTMKASSTNPAFILVEDVGV